MKVLGLVGIVLACGTTVFADDYRVELITARKGFDGNTCWVHARAGVIPARTGGNDADAPLAVMTLNKLLLSGSDVFYATNHMLSVDGGRTWSEPVANEDSMGRRDEPGGVIVVPCDITPAWHAKTGKLLATGQNVRYTGDKGPLHVRTRQTVYSVFDPETGEWSERKWLTMPDLPRFKNAGAGSTQRYDLPDGDILLPVYFKEPHETVNASTVVRCRFDGETLEYLEHGDELSIPVVRGFCEPSLTKIGRRFFLTLRNDEDGYVTSGVDGLHFDAPKKWTFDDGEILGNYNTQQHWLTHGDTLYLVYTRKGADNDHVFRHRAPLFMAEIDQDRLCVKRATERIIVPERGARLGNFGITKVSPDEAWIVVTEWMQPKGCEKYGSDNSVYVARLTWGSE